MKKRIIAAALALCLVFASGVPALASDEPRLTGVNVYVDGELAIQYTYTYEKGPLPTAGRMRQYVERTIFRNGQHYEAVPPDTVYAYAYDNEGRMVRYEASIDDGSGSTSAHTREYGEDGRLLRDIWTSDMASGGGGSSYIYDEAGRLIRSMDEDEYGIVRYVTEYDCDEAGRVTSHRLYDVMDWDEVGEPTVWGPDPVSEIRYGYDDAGRMNYQMNLYNGMVNDETFYTYGEDPYFTLRYGEIHDYMNNEVKNEFTVIPSNDGPLAFSMPGAPALIRDEAGRLIRAEAGERVMEFIYTES